jgi:hypothetical protein
LEELPEKADDLPLSVAFSSDSPPNDSLTSYDELSEQSDSSEKEKKKAEHLTSDKDEVKHFSHAHKNKIKSNQPLSSKELRKLKVTLK